MPRQLPWKVSVGSTPQAKRSRTSESPASPFSPGAGVPRSRTSTLVGVKSRRSLIAKTDRSPSTSPPPEPLAEDFMIEGIDQDDQYRMVEDEFLAMAGNFTRHLHAAEYQRLKALASTRNADVIQAISRPVTGHMVDPVKRRIAVLELAAKQRTGLRNARGKRKAGMEDSDSDDDDDELPWTGTSLQGLMESHRNQAAPLPAVSSSGIASRGTTTHQRSTAASVSVSRFATKSEPGHVNAAMDTSTDDDDDDLDTQRKPAHQTIGLKRSATSTVSLNQKATSLEAMTRRHEPALPALPSKRIEPTRSTSMVVESAPTTISGRDTASEHDEDEEDFLARIRNRRAQQRKRREGSGTEDAQKKAKHRNAVDAIPFVHGSSAC